MSLQSQCQAVLKGEGASIDISNGQITFDFMSVSHA